MRTTIDRGGRVVIPKPFRDEAGLSEGAEVEIVLRDGRIEIEPVAVPMRVVVRGGRVTIEPAAELPPLSGEDVRAVLERARR